jgi:hypothetical protein
LSRSLRVVKGCLIYGLDLKHIDILRREFGLDESSKGVDSQNSKDDISRGVVVGGARSRRGDQV